MMWRIRRITTNIKNLITWFPVIWNDRQYDHSFMFSIFEKKLELMEKDTYSWLSVGSEKDTKRIKTARILCKRLAEEEIYYEDNLIFPRTLIAYTRTRINQDLDLLCKTLRKYSLRWWD